MALDHTPLAGCGAHVKGVLGIGKVDLPDLTRGFPSTGTFGANMASTVLLCHMTAKRWANVFAGGACGRTSHASRGGQTVSQSLTLLASVVIVWRVVRP